MIDQNLLGIKVICQASIIDADISKQIKMVICFGEGLVHCHGNSMFKGM